MTFARANVNIMYGRKWGDRMSPKTGRPTTNKKTERLEIRLTPDELEVMEECAKILKMSKTDVINKGIKLVKGEIDKEK